MKVTKASKYFASASCADETTGREVTQQQLVQTIMFQVLLVHNAGAEELTTHLGSAATKLLQVPRRAIADVFCGAG
jgi:hypothetical protein